MTDLDAALEALERGVRLATDVIAEEAIAGVGRTVDAARQRHGYLGETVVVALGGGTGAGKSSLLNAIAGSAVARIGALRPTTSEPLAWIPANPEPGLVRLLDDLGITHRIGHEGGRKLAVVDLPDFDSVEESHRATVERLLPRLDAVLWVLDPQKYADRRLHSDFLAPLSGYRDQFRFVLNQTDRLEPPEVGAVVDDLVRLLEADGMGRPEIIETATPRGRPASGIADLLEHLDRTFDTKRIVLSKLAQDVRAGAAVLGSAIGAGSEGAPALPAWEPARNVAIETLVTGIVGPDAVAAAVLGGRRAAASHGSGPLGRGLAAVRRSLAGRALGALPQDGGFERLVRGMPRAGAVEAAASQLRTHVTTVAGALGDAFGDRLRRTYPVAELDRFTAATVEGALDAIEPVEPGTARWWPVAGFVQFVLFAAIVAGLVWLWADPTPFRRGEWPWAAILGGGAALASYGLHRVVSASGARRGRRTVAMFTDTLRPQLADRLDRLIGDPIAEVTERRRALVSALADAAAAADRVTASVH